MIPELEAVRSHRAVVVSIVAAAVAVTLFCLVGIAVMLGWAGKRGATTPMSMAAPGQQVTGTATDIDLVAGETLVAPAAAPATRARPEPMMPTYGKPAIPRAAPADVAPAASPPSKVLPAWPGKPPVSAWPTPAPPDPGSASPSYAPVAPNHARIPPHPTDANDDWPQGTPCRSCGTVSAIATFPDLWEVRVRFDQGGSRIVRYPTAPPYRVGDRVRLADGRLERE